MTVAAAKLQPARQEDDLRCGLGSWRPSCLQVFNTAAWVVAFMSFGNCVQSLTINGLIGVVLSSVERRFDLASSQSSWIASAYEIGTLPALLVVSYLGARVHRPRVVSLGLVTVSVGCILFFLPHFLTPTYRTNTALSGRDDSLCVNSTDVSQCHQDSMSSSKYLPMFVVANLLMGIGATPIYTLGMTFMDDCATKDKFSLYIGIFYALGVIGPAIGTIGGGFLLNIHTDFYAISVKELAIDSSSTHWVGAWWICFCIGMGLCLFAALPISCYNKDIPGAEEMRKTKKSEAHSVTDVQKHDDVHAGPDYAPSISAIPSHLKIILTNPAFIMTTLFVSCDSLVINGFTAFGPKYLENQFSLPSWRAGALFGAVLLPAGAGGTVIGGAIVSRMKLSCARIMKAEAIVTLLVLITAFMLLIKCDNLKFAGVTVPYNESASVFRRGIDDTCNIGCACEQVPYTPICSYDNTRYYSPCHAGCKSMTEDDITYYHNCSCISGAEETNMAPASSKDCTETSCKTLPLFLTIFFFAVVFIFMCSTMNVTATLRSVPAAQRSVAVGVQWFSLRLLGSIPGPLLFGAFFDASCLLWQNNCGKKGSCLYYDNNHISIYIFAACSAIKLLSVICIVTGYCLYRPPPDDSVPFADLSSACLESSAADRNDTIGEVNLACQADEATQDKTE